MPRLIWDFAGRTLILLVLSCHGSFFNLGFMGFLRLLSQLLGRKKHETPTKTTYPHASNLAMQLAKECSRVLLRQTAAKLTWLKMPILVSCVHIRLWHATFSTLVTRSQNIFLANHIHFPDKIFRQNTIKSYSVHNLSPVKRICVFEQSVMTSFNCACPAIQRGQGYGFLSEGSSWLTALYERAAEVLARLRRCAGSPEPSLLA